VRVDPAMDMVVGGARNKNGAGLANALQPSLQVIAKTASPRDRLRLQVTPPE